MLRRLALMHVRTRHSCVMQIGTDARKNKAFMCYDIGIDA